MNPVKCQTCQTEIQPAIADRTGGFCTPCAMAADLVFAEKVEADKGAAAVQKESFGKQALALITVLLLGGAFMIAAFIAKIAVSIIAVLIARFAFETTWDRAFFAGVITYLVLGFIGLILDEWPQKRSRSKAKTLNE
ncbi:MAG: hypothetical protein K0Q55_778 [Verrucomicrobia bacterium]|jgi:hypothetical protein|nr:hypothetical protein [Verrucomicrobiota bacterium]